MLRRSLAASLVTALALAARAAAAQAPSPEDQALATSLFREAKALLEAGKVPEACRKLEESQRLDPGGGTLLNLAVCHEREGKTATAWAEFRQARFAAENARFPERLELAQEHERALEPKLSKLTIRVPADVEVADIEVVLDLRPVRRPAWGTAIPVDPGEHVVDARAPGKKPWRLVVQLADSGDRREVAVPPFESEVSPDVVPLVPSPPPTLAENPAATAPRSDRTAALVTGSIGATGIVVGAVAGLYAIKKHDESPCTMNPCSSESIRANDAAKTAADVSTVAFTLGAIGLGVAAYLWFSGPRSAAPARTVRLAPSGIGGVF